MPAAKFLFAILFLHGLVKEVFSDREEDSNGSVSRALESILDSTDSGGEDILKMKPKLYMFVNLILILRWMCNNLSGWFFGPPAPQQISTGKINYIFRRNCNSITCGFDLILHTAGIQQPAVHSNTSCTLPPNFCVQFPDGNSRMLQFLWYL